MTAVSGVWETFVPAAMPLLPRLQRKKKKSGCRVPILSRRESPTMQTSRAQDRGG